MNACASQEKYRSSYEKQNPLVPPRTLKLGTGNLTVLRTMGLGKGRKKGAARDDMYDMMREADDSPVSRTGLVCQAHACWRCMWQCWVVPSRSRDDRGKMMTSLPFCFCNAGLAAKLAELESHLNPAAEEDYYEY